MKIIVGIGNPGKTYDSTRHNVGFQLLDRLAEKLGLDPGPRGKWLKDNRLQAEVQLREDAALVKPLTFVNLSGESVLAIIERLKVTPKDLLIVCDDVNLELGKMRLREIGSAGGHHGLESIIERLGTDEFSRLRVGVGQEGMPDDLTSFVLGRFDSKERKELEPILDRAVLVCEAWINKGFESARDRLSQLQSVKEKGE